MQNNVMQQREARERRQAWQRARREKLIVSLLFFLGAALVLWLMFWK